MPTLLPSWPTLHPEQHHAGRLAARGPEVGVIEELPGKNATTTHVLALLQWMELPVSTVAANEAAPGHMNTTMLTAQSTMNAMKREANPACWPRRFPFVRCCAEGIAGGCRREGRVAIRRRDWALVPAGQHLHGRRGHGSSGVFGNSGGSARPVWLRRILLTSVRGCRRCDRVAASLVNRLGG